MSPKVTDRLASLSHKLRERVNVVASAPLDQKDVDYVLDILVMRTALLHDLLDGSTQAEKISTAWERTISGLTTLDVGLYAQDWKTLREIFTSSDFLANVHHDDGTVAPWFKHMAKRRIHYMWILNATLALLEGPDWQFKANQWIVFDSRVNLASLDLTTECCREYLDFESDLPDPDFWERELDTCDYERQGRRDDLRLLQLCAREMIGDFYITDYPFRPKHGNGATREVKRSTADSWHKNRQFAVDGEIINYLRHRVPEEDWQNLFYLPYRGLERTCDLVCVPKSLTKNRTISKEPTTLQFLQQDIFRAMDDYFTQHPMLGIDLHDQDRSRRLAQAGSSDGSYATIDLSSASDSVSVALVNVLFRGLPIWYPLMATRSNSVHVRSRDNAIDTVIPLRKFAPMGSATCFPVESLVFAILCEAAVRRTTGRKSRSNDYVVYGDDIVIRQEYAAPLAYLLDEFMFSVNVDKSFGIYDKPGSHVNTFREACGVEAMNGVDITPLRLSRRLVSVTNNDSDHQAGLGVGMIDLVNRSYLYGYKTLRRWINDVLVRHKWYRTVLRLSSSDYREFSADVIAKRPSWITVAIPFVITDDLSDTQWRAYRSRSGLADPYHRCSALVTTAVSRRPMVQRHDSNDYYSWVLRAATDPVADDVFVVDDTGIVTIRPRDLKWVKTWVSLQRPAHLTLQVQ